jgi:replication factor A1
MVVRVSDASSEALVSLFNDDAEKIVGCSADELDKLKSQVNCHRNNWLFKCSM